MRVDPRVTQVRLRDFEVPMSGGFYLAEHSDELADFFTPGVEIETWRTRGELLEKCRHYLDRRHEEERNRIAAAGRAWRLREHTLGASFRRRFSHDGSGMSAPLISVIMPVHNAAPTSSWERRSAVLSRKPWATSNSLIVDDASTDGSAEIIGQFRRPSDSRASAQ